MFFYLQCSNITFGYILYSKVWLFFFILICVPNLYLALFGMSRNEQQSISVSHHDTCFIQSTDFVLIWVDIESLFIRHVSHKSDALTARLSDKFSFYRIYEYVLPPERFIRFYYYYFLFGNHFFMRPEHDTRSYSFCFLCTHI